MTFLGKIKSIYSNQIRSSKKRGHNPPTYSKEEFFVFCLHSIEFNLIYKKWVESGFNKWKAPSIDRKDNFKGYSFDNIQVMTWKENSDKARFDIKNGRNSNRGKSIIVYSNNFKKEYSSLILASKDLGVSSSNIIKVIKGERNHTGGYKIKYK